MYQATSIIDIKLENNWKDNTFYVSLEKREIKHKRIKYKILKYTYIFLFLNTKKLQILEIRLKI